MMEWRKIPGFSRYSVSESGTVRRDERIYNFKPGYVSSCLNDRGYYKVTVRSDDGRQRTITVHTLVALAFLGERPDGLFICHNDGIKTNNHYLNLRYDTAKSNTQDALKHLSAAFGTKHPLAKLSEPDVLEIVDLYKSGLFTQAQIGAMYGVCQRTIWHVIHCLKWRHVVRSGELRGIVVGVAA